jgi:hypothetical protein
MCVCDYLTPRFDPATEDEDGRTSMNLSRQMDKPMSVGLLALKQSHSKMYGNISELDRSELRDCGRIILAATSLVRRSVRSYCVRNWDLSLACSSHMQTYWVACGSVDAGKCQKKGLSRLPLVELLP